MPRLGHQLVGLDDGDVGQAAEIGLESPDPLVVGQYRVVVRGRVLVVHVVAVHRDPVTGPPFADRRAHPEHHSGGIGAHHVVVEGVPGAPLALLAEPVQETEGGKGFEDRGPYGVEVDGRGHDRDVGLIRGQLGESDPIDMERLAGVLVVGLHPREHLDLVPPDERRAIGLRKGHLCQLVAGSAVDDGLEDLIHGQRRYRARSMSYRPVPSRPNQPGGAPAQGVRRPTSASSGGHRHARFGHRLRSQDSDREALRRLCRLHRHGPRRVRHPVGSRACRPQPRPGRLRPHGSGAPRRTRPDHGTPGGRQGRHPDERAGDHRQQGVPLRPQHHLPGRPDDRGRGRGDRGGRGDGVDDPGAVPAGGGTCRFPDG